MKLLLLVLPGLAAAFSPARPHGGAAVRLAASSSSVDVADLEITMADLEKELAPGAVSLATEGYESTSRSGASDDGCRWRESADAVDVELTIPGLRGQPSGSLAVDLTSTTCTVTAFGMVVWSCLLKGRADPSTAVVGVSDGADMTPVIDIRVERQDFARWGGFIASIGEDSIL